MLGFSPFKKHANKFNYTPRYYDPEKERRAKRRAELLGTDDVADAQTGYQPGQYIRRAAQLRADRRHEATARKRNRIWVLVLVVGLLVLFVYAIYPRLVAAFAPAQAPVPTAVEQEFDPYAPIVIVPNDYQE